MTQCAYAHILKNLKVNVRWVKRLYRVEKTMHFDFIEYKGMTKFHPLMVNWLAKFDDGAVLDVCTQSE